MSTPIDSLREMSPNARHALRKAGLESLEQAAAMADADLLALKGFAGDSLQRLRLWQAGEPQPATLDREREGRVFDLYNTLRGKGAAPADAIRSAIDEVKEFYRQLREAS
jgi:hypothetical protein